MHDPNYYGDGKGAFLRWSHSVGPKTLMNGCSEEHDELLLFHVQHMTDEGESVECLMLDDGHDETPYSTYARWEEWVRLARLVIAEDERRRERHPSEWDFRYRMLSEGEIVMKGDDWLINEEVGWEPPGPFSIGKKAADPLYESHTWFRRLISEEM